MANDERPAALAQRAVELDHGGVDELDPAVGGQSFVEQLVQDRPVEDERAVHAPRLPQRVVQRGMVVRAQIAPEPDERGVHDGRIQDSGLRIERIDAEGRGLADRR